ncbi:MAG TPA: hypothetical protein VK974_04130 [Methylophilaceae bacterium]|nr:hypothetical protein [Methylophilaceae bacterium]
MLEKISDLKVVKRISAINECQLQWLLTLVAALITCRVIYIQHGWINDDSVLYFEVARLFSLNEWKQGFALYNWPLFPALIAIIQKISGIGFQHAAQLLNVLFFSLTTFSFITLIRLAGGNKTTIACGAALLFSSPYISGDILSMLLRDQGFWACFLTSIAFFFKFYRDGKLKDCLQWQVFATFAVLFRIEAVIFLTCLPFVLLTDSTIEVSVRIRRVLKCHLLTILLGLLGIATAIFIPSIKLSDFGRIQEIFNLFDYTSLKISHDLATKSQVVGQQILGDFLDEYGLFGLVLTLIGIVLVKSMSTAGWLTVGLIAGTRKTVLPTLDKGVRKLILWVALLALLNAYVIILSTFVLSGRYLIALAFMLLILAAFSLASLLKRFRTHPNPDYKQKGLIFLIIIVMSGSLMSNLAAKKHGYNYEQDAVRFVKQLNPYNDNIFYVSPRARYYAGAPYLGRGYNYWSFVSKAISDGSIQQYDYLVINMNNDHPERETQLIEALPNHELIKQFVGFKAKKKMMIFSRKQRK